VDPVTARDWGVLRDTVSVAMCTAASTGLKKNASEALQDSIGNKETPIFFAYVSG